MCTGILTKGGQLCTMILTKGGALVHGELPRDNLLHTAPAQQELRLRADDSGVAGQAAVIAQLLQRTRTHRMVGQRRHLVTPSIDASPTCTTVVAIYVQLTSSVPNGGNFS